MNRSLRFGTLLALTCLAATLMLVLSGCAAAMSALDIQNPRYSFRDIRPRVDVAIPLTSSRIDFDFAIDIDNPNRVGLRLDEVDFSLFVNGNRILDSVSQQNVRIPANGIGTVHLRTSVGYNSIRTIWTQVADVINGRQANYEIRGNAYYHTPAGRLQFPLTVYSSR
jgi:LEA14-like dessication related protein